jgi:N-acetylmuramoyl-L-alanine amidase/Mannosyl-glycoprotein endo-beta-N-acetylglucosaminidase
MTIKQLLKNEKYPVNHGYDLRSPVPLSYAIVVHSTNGRLHSTYPAEEAYLYKSPLVSAHYLIGKAGQITQFLDVTKYRAWHTGGVKSTKYNNNNTIGIECHYTPGENNDLPDMILALTNLVTLLKSHYPISEIVTHREIAVPLGRKIDPSFWSDSEFASWLETIHNPIAFRDVRILNQKNIPYSSILQTLVRKDVANAELIASAYTTFGELTGIGNLYPLAQAIHETGWFTSPRWKTAFNPAGLGATNDGAWGAVFDTVAAGVLAQYAHLLCYATTPEQNNYLLEKIALLSPRYAAMDAAFGRGSATTWVGLNGKWALPGNSYGNKIIEIAQSIHSW